MKRIFCLLLITILLCACGCASSQDVTNGEGTGSDTGNAENDSEFPCVGTNTPSQGDENNTDSEYGADFADCVKDAWEKGGYLDDMTPYSEEDLLDYYGIDLSVCKCGMGYADAVGYTTEAVVVVAEEAIAEEIETMLADHLASMKDTFRSYDPDAYKIAEDAVLLREGGMVLLIVSPDAKAMLETFRGVNP